MHVVLAYDIPDDRRRTRLADRLTELLHRVQKSVFEGEVDEALLEKVYRCVEEEADFAEDSVILYRLCKNCLATVEYLGTARPFAPSRDEDEVV